MSTKLIKNASSLLLVQILNPLLGMAFVVTLARINGTVGLGAYTFAISMVAIFENIAGLGIREYIIREIGKNPASWRPLFNCAMAIGVVTSLVGQAAMLIFAGVVGYDAETINGLFIISFSLLPGVIFYHAVSFLYAFDRMTVASLTFIVETVVRTVLGLAIVFFGFGMNWLLASFAFSRVVAAALAGWAQNQHPHPAGRAWDREVFRHLLKVTPTFVGMTILATIYWRLNIIMLSKMCGAEAVGEYSAGYRLMDLLVFAGGSILTATYPAMTRLFHHVRKDFQLLMDKGIQYTIAGYLPVVVAVHVMSPKIIALFFGEKFDAAVEGLRLLSWVTLPLILAKHLANGLIIAGRQDLDLRVNAYRLAFNAILSYMLIANMGMVGACWAMLISLLASVVLQVYYLREIARPTVSLAQVLKPGLAVGAMLVGLQLTSAWPLIPQALFAALIYLAAFLTLKPFDMEDRRMWHCLGQQPQNA